ncbi:hypothetical protein HUU53_03760 [Candidatus Micrarchaeota archaeon]|nr:hypothetical protein [Candidatus Micrarchaeota archaeon]
MNKRLEKLAFAAVGSALLTKKKVDAFVDELIDSNALSEAEGKAFVGLVLKKFKAEEKKFEKLFSYKKTVKTKRRKK